MSEGAGDGSGNATGVKPGALTALLQEVAAAPERREEEPLSLPPGTVIGRFEIVRELGRGGFGVVYEARDRDLGRQVAVKLVRPGRIMEEDGKVSREAEAIARLAHPNLITLFEVGRCEHGPFLVFELLRGKTLDLQDRGRAAPGPGGRPHRDGDRPRAVPRPRGGSDPPGLEARERLRDDQGAGEDPRLRDGACVRAASPERRDAGLHGTGTVGGLPRGRADGRLRTRGDALPDAVGGVPVPGTGGEVGGGPRDAPEAGRSWRTGACRRGGADARPDAQGAPPRRGGGAGGAPAHRGQAPGEAGGRLAPGSRAAEEGDLRRPARGAQATPRLPGDGGVRDLRLRRAPGHRADHAWRAPAGLGADRRARGARAGVPGRGDPGLGLRSDVPGCEADAVGHGSGGGPVRPGAAPAAARGGRGRARHRLRGGRDLAPLDGGQRPKASGGIGPPGGPRRAHGRRGGRLRERHRGEAAERDDRPARHLAGAVEEAAPPHAGPDDRRRTPARPPGRGHRRGRRAKRGAARRRSRFSSSPRSTSSAPPMSSSSAPSISPRTSTGSP